MRRWLQHRLEQDRGAVLALMAGALFFLIGAAAFGVDLGWLYLNNTRIQKAADAAALAAVVHVPGDYAEAEAVLLDMAARNGWTDGANASVSWTSPVNGNDRRLKVDVQGTVDTFFLRVFGMETVSIHKDAIAEYVLPLPMGSPLNYFGNPGDPEAISGEPNFWGNIHGHYTTRVMGDAFSSACKSGNGPACTPNEWWRSSGYVYAVEVAEGSSGLTVQIFDGPFTRNGTNKNDCDADPPLTKAGHDLCYTGDHNVCGGCQGPGPTLKFTLYGADDTPLEWEDNPVVCSQTWDPQPGSEHFTWKALCSIGGSLTPGVYPLQIQVVQAGGGALNTGLNRFSILANTAAGPSPRVYGLGDMAIYANIDAGVSEFFLAEVDEVHAGKELRIDLFDPGDANGTNFITVLDPLGNSPACRLEVPADGIDTTLNPCTINATRPTFNYNGDWLYISIDLPPGYSCDANPFPSGNGCWWKLRYNYTKQANDTTTWTASIVGDPVRLVLGGG